jgi:hypothetical protein
MDFCKKIFRNIFLLGLLTACMPVLFNLNPSAAATDPANDSDNLETVTVNALVMEVYPKESLMVVGEKRIFITKPVVGSPFKTDLEDQNDREVKLDDFNTGERVLVKGYQLPDGAVKAESIKKIPPHPSDIAN